MDHFAQFPAFIGFHGVAGSVHHPFLQHLVALPHAFAHRRRAKGIHNQAAGPCAPDLKAL